MKPLILLALAMLVATTVHAQKKELLEDKATILARANEALDDAMKPGGALYEAVVKEKLTGKYTLQISIHEKGDISSVFVESAETHDIRSQNRFKDLVHFLKLPFKMPKGRQYRIAHTFNLNTITH